MLWILIFQANGKLYTKYRIKLFERVLASLEKQTIENHSTYNLDVDPTS